MEPNSQAQSSRVETVNSLLWQPIQVPEPLVIPPLLFNRPPGGTPTHIVSPPPLPPPLAHSNQIRSSLDPAVIEQVSSMDFSWEKAQFKGDIHTINTNFVYERNEEIKYHRTDPQKRYDYTQRQRKATLSAREAKDVESIRRLLWQQLLTGKRKLEDWVEFDTDILNGYVSYCFSHSSHLTLPQNDDPFQQHIRQGSGDYPSPNPQPPCQRLLQYSKDNFQRCFC